MKLCGSTNVKSSTQIIIAAMLLVSFALGQVTIDGYAYLENQTDHSGITITFERTAPSSLTESTTTLADGYFSAQLDNGIYNISYQEEGFRGQTEVDINCYANVNLDTLTLLEYRELIYVPDDHTSIQVALNLILPGGTIHVAPGTYQENLSWPATAGIKLIGSGPENCIIDGGGISEVINISTSIVDTSTQISGFSITNGNAQWGGGIKLDSASPRIANIHVYENTGGIWAMRSSAIIKNSLIWNNSSDGIYLRLGSDITLRQVTIVQNNKGIYFGQCTADIRNSIIRDNSYADLDNYASSPQINYSNFGTLTGYSFNYIGVNMITNANGDSCDIYYNIQEDPLFADVTNGDYNLQQSSPCIDAGDPTSLLDPDGSIADMGAYPSPYGTPVPIVIDIPNDYSTIQSGLNAANTNDTVLVQPGTYYENIFWPETNGIKLISAGDSSNTIIDGGGVGRVIYMNPQTTTIDTTTLIRGFKVTNGGNVVNGGGIYLRNSHPRLNLISIQNNSTTYVGGSGSGGGMYLENSNPTINSLNITGNEAGRSGGGMYLTNSSPILTNIEINSNNAYGLGWGGGLMLEDQSNALLRNVNIYENITGSLGEGAGISIHSSNPSLTDVNIYENATGYAGRGGGMYLQSSNPNLNGVNIYKNIAHEEGGGMHIYVSAPIVHDVKIFDNMADENGGGINILSSGIILDGCSIMNNTSNKGGGIYVVWGSHVIRRSNILNNHSSQQSNGLYISTGTVEIDSCNIVNWGNSIYNNDNSTYVTAINNWFGKMSGPFHPIQNPSGLGDSTNAFVNVTPWLTAPDTDAPPISAQNVAVTGTGNDFVSLNWDSSPLGDFAGFKLYYDSDESGYPYENSVDLGSNTSHTLAGLNLGTEYFLAITVYDTDGNESWYSNEVTGVTRVMEVQNLDIAGDENLQHLTTHDPTITFDYFDSMGETQTNYQVQISTDSTFQSNLIWDSGEVLSDAASIQYSEGALIDGVSYYLRARVASGSFWSEWSELAFRMNSMPMPAVNLSLINDEVTQMAAQLTVQRSSDPESDSLSYDLRLYADRALAEPIDSALGLAADGNLVYWQIMTPMLDNERFWWTSQVFDGYEYSEVTGPDSFIVNWNNDIPAEFNLTSPWPGQAITSQSPLFTWDRAIDMDPLDTVRYVLYLDTPEPGTLTFDIDTDTSFQFLDVLEDNTSYNWKVTAHDVAGALTTNIGGYQSFTVNTENDVPTAFNLLTPTTDMMVTTLTPEFLWEASSDPDDETIVMRSSGKDRKTDLLSGGDNSVMVITGYDFYLGTDAELTDVIPVEVVGTSYIPTEELLENQVYYWTVSALDDSGGVTFSDTASFWTNSESEAPTAFNLNFPTDGEM